MAVRGDDLKTNILLPPPLWERAGVGGRRSLGGPATPHPNPPPQGGREQDHHAARNEANDAAPNEANPAAPNEAGDEWPRMIGSIVIRPPTSNRRLVDVIVETALQDPKVGRGRGPEYGLRE
jgi:hypothetical protein